MRITISDARLGKPGEAVPDALEAAFREAVLFLEAEVSARAPDPAERRGATGTARASIAGEVIRGPRGMPSGTVGSPLIHVQVMNDGRRPGSKMPPPEALELWVRRTILVTTDEDGKERRLKPEEVPHVALMVARAIGARGTRPMRFFESAIEENEDKLRRIFSRVGAGIGIRFTRDRRR